MRKLMWFSLGFGTACLLGAYAFGGEVLLWSAAVCLLLCVAAAVWVKSLPGRAVAWVLAGLTLGFGWFWGHDLLILEPVRALDTQTLELTVQTTDYSYDTDYGVAADGTAILAGRACRVRVYVNTSEQLPPGSVLQGSFRLRFTASGGRDDPTYHRGEGIYLLAYPVGDTALSLPKEKQWRFLPAYLRNTVLNTIRSAFPGDTAAFACALLLGDSSGLDYETDTAFKLSGIRHVIAVSGLHVSILFSLIYAFTFRRRYLTALVGIPLLFLFAAMAGFTPSIVRACLMQLLMLSALVLSKEYDPPSALAFAVVTMLAANPQTVTSVGFQLSVASVAGILLFSERIRVWLLSPGRLGEIKGKTLKTKLKNWFASSCAVTLSAMVLTVPLTALYFGTVSLVSPLTNLLTMWVISFIFCGIIFVCVVGLVWLPAGQLIAWCVSWPIRYVIAMAKMLGGLPVAAVYTVSPYITAWLVFCYVLLFVFLVSRIKKQGFLTCCMVIGLCAALLASWLEPVSGNYRVTVLDVGQGQCVLLQSGGKTYMVDCGGSHDESVADLAAATLLSQGIRRLDGLILTHYDRDHVGAAAMLLSRVGADTVYLPGMEDTQNTAPELRHIHGVRVTEDICLQFGQTSLTILAADAGNSDNESSLCVLFQGKKCDILITGDRGALGELSLLRDTRLPDLEILVAGHHGADTSTTPALLRGTMPETVIISVEADNRYGHPSENLLQRLEAFGCAVRRTDLEGTIIIRG